MGMLIEGTWHDRWYDTEKHDGHFVREDSLFRDWIRADGSSGFPAESGRYHLYVAWGCPWAHRALIVRKLKKLDAAIGVSIAEPLMLENGWTFSEDKPDHLYGSRHLHEIYTRAKPDYTGRVTVPVLWDRVKETIVNNESSEIIRMLDSEMNALGDASVELYPEALREEIDALNDVVYRTVNNGVYRAGFATRQHAYDQAVRELFESLEMLEARLDGHDFLVGDRFTEADIRLFTTLFRFDPVYHFHFKCNLKRLRDYPNLWAFTKRIYAMPGMTETLDLKEVKEHYFGSHRKLNPTGIIPYGPVIDYAS